jgi:hypothetical protein
VARPRNSSSMEIPKLEKKVIMMKDKIPNIADIIASYANQDKITYESAADLGAITLEMKHEKDHYGENTERMAEIQKMAELQERVIRRMLENSLEESHQPKRPHLTVVK